MEKGSNVTLWCNGLSVSASSSGGKRARAVELSESEREVEFCRRFKKKGSDTNDDKVGQNNNELKQKPCKAAYTPMQYLIWGEMSVGVFTLVVIILHHLQCLSELVEEQQRKLVRRLILWCQELGVVQPK